MTSVMFLLVFRYGTWIINTASLRLRVGLSFWSWLWLTLYHSLHICHQPKNSKDPGALRMTYD